MSSNYSTDFDIIQYINRKIQEEVNNILQLHETKFSQLRNDTLNILSHYENRLNLLQQEILTINGKLHTFRLIISQQETIQRGQFNHTNNHRLLPEMSDDLSMDVLDESYHPEDDFNTTISTETSTQIINNTEEMKQEESLPVNQQQESL